MKKLRKLIVLMLAAAMLLCLTGCGAKSELVGKWKAVLAIGPTIAAEIDEGANETATESGYDATTLPSAADYLSDITMAYHLDLKSDGTYKLYIDSDTLKVDLRNAFGEWCVALYINMFQQAGINVNAYGSTDKERVEAIMGSSIEETVDEMLNELDDVFNYEAEGKYTASNGKLCLSAGLDYRPDSSMYYTYTLGSGEFTMSDPLNIDEGMEWAYPMTMSYVGAAD